MKPLSRRRFLLSSGLLGVTTLATLSPGGSIAEAVLGETPLVPLAAQSRGGAPIAVARGAAYEKKLVQAIDALGGTRLVARRGERVVIKPVLGWNRGPGQGVNVHPAVLQATIAMALRGGASEVVVFDRTNLRSDWAYRISGADEVVRQIDDRRVRLIHLDGADLVPFEVGRVQTPLAQLGARWPGDGAGQDDRLQGHYVCRHILDADRVINLCTARQHPTWQVALGMVNLLGLIGGGPADAAWHQNKDATLALLSAAIRPELTILDATYAVVRNGPLGRAADDVMRWDTLVVSQDPLAVEAYGAALFGLDPRALEHLRLAEQLGVGTATIDQHRLIEL